MGRPGRKGQLCLETYGFLSFINIALPTRTGAKIFQQNIAVVISQFNSWNKVAVALGNYCHLSKGDVHTAKSSRKVRGQVSHKSHIYFLVMIYLIRRVPQAECEQRLVLNGNISLYQCKVAWVETFPSTNQCKVAWIQRNKGPAH